MAACARCGDDLGVNYVELGPHLVCESCGQALAQLGRAMIELDRLAYGDAFVDSRLREIDVHLNKPTLKH